MLLVDGNESELREHRALLHERVCADYKQWNFFTHSLRCVRALPRVQAPGYKQRLNSKRLQQPGDGPEMLLGQKLCGRHDRGLISVLHREQRGKEGDDCFSAPDV